MPLPIVNEPNNFLIVDKYEASVLWTVIKKESMSIYDLEKETFYVPEGHSEDTFVGGNQEAYLDEIGKPLGKQYASLHRILTRLAKKGLITLTKDTNGPRIKKIVAPTFIAIVFFLQNSDMKEFEANINLIRNKHEESVPFLQQWEKIKALVKNSRGILKQTIYDFHSIQKVKFIILNPKLTFEGFLESPEIFLNFLKANESGIYNRKNDKVFEFLKGSDLVDLKNAYLAFIALKDIELLSRIQSQKLDIIYPDLLSEQEFKLFEGEDKSLLRGDSLRVIFPKYATLEYFFTGLLFRNLLWSVNTDKTQMRYNYYLKYHNE
jgi:hypothetical protein